MPMFGNNPFGVRDLSVSTFANEMVEGMRELNNVRRRESLRRSY